MSIEKLISPFIESQFPQFYQEEGPQFIEFVKAYYSWLESQGEILHEARSLLEYKDLDTTLQNFMVYFKNKYINSIPENVLADKSLLIKYILDLYRSKGSDRSYALLFKLLFNEDIEVYTPGKDIFKLSDGEWVVPRYIELTDCPFFVNTIGHKIYSSGTFATAVVDNYFVKIVNNKYINVLVLNDVKGNFKFGEKILCEAVPEITIETAPIIVGSLSSIGVTDGGINYNVGDLVNVNNSGVGGVARVVSTTERNGQVQFTLLDGGSGFSLDAIVNVVGETREIDSITLESFVHVDVNKTEGTFDPYEDIYFSNNFIANNKISGAVLSVSSNTVTGNNVLSVTLSPGDLVYFESNNQVSVPDTKVNTSTYKINIDNHGYSRGDNIYYLSVGEQHIQYELNSVTYDLIDNEKYFAVVDEEDPNNIKLALTFDDALLGETDDNFVLHLSNPGNADQIFKNTKLNANVIVRTVDSIPDDTSFVLTERPSWSSANASSGIITGTGVIRDFDYVTGNVVISNSSVHKVITDIGPPEVSISPIDYLTTDHKIIASSSQAGTVIISSDDVRYAITVKPLDVKVNNKVVDVKGHLLENRDTVRLDYIQGFESLNIENYGYYVKVINTYAFEIFTDYDLDANSSSNYYTDEAKKANYQIPVTDNPTLTYIQNSGFTYQNPGGVGATFKIGSIVNKEIYRLNTDHIEDYANERVESDARVGGGFEILVSDVVGTFSSGDILVMANSVNVKQLDASKTVIETLMTNNEFMYSTNLIGSESEPTLTVVNTDGTYIEVRSTDPNSTDDGVNHPQLSGQPARVVSESDVDTVTDEISMLNHVYQNGDPTYYKSNNGDSIKFYDYESYLIVANTVGVESTENAIFYENANTYFSINDIVHYSVGSGTEIDGLTDDTDYYISFCNTTAFALKEDLISANIDITEIREDDPGEVHTFKKVEYLKDNGVYYVYSNDVSKFKLASTKDKAIYGMTFDLIEPGNNNQSFREENLQRYYFPGNSLESTGNEFSAGSSYHVDAILDDKVISLSGGECTSVIANRIQLQQVEICPPVVGYPINGETLKSIGHRFNPYNSIGVDQGLYLVNGTPCILYVPAFSAPPTNTPVYFDVYDDENYPQPTLPYNINPGQIYYSKYVDLDPYDETDIFHNQIHLSETPFIPVLMSQVNITDNTITIENHGFTSGDEIYYVSKNDVDALVGEKITYNDGTEHELEDELTYYVYVVDVDTIKLALTSVDGEDGTNLLNLTNDGNNYQTVRKTPLIGCGSEYNPDYLETGAGDPSSYPAYQYPPQPETKYEVYFDKASGTITKTNRLTHYDFPKITVAPYDDRENMDTVISNALTYVDKEVGDIARLKNINTGEGYAEDPKVVIIEPLIYELREIGKNGGYKGFNANVYAKAGYAGGIATAIEIVDSGYGYERDQQVALTNANNPYAIVGTTVVDLGGKGKGYWKGNQGFLSDQIYLEDSYYYQKFSYEIIASRMLNTYEKYVKDLVHPSGMKLFGRFINKSELQLDDAEVMFSSLNKNVISIVEPPPVINQILTVDNTLESVDETSFSSDRLLDPYIPPVTGTTS